MYDLFNSKCDCVAILISSLFTFFLDGISFFQKKGVIKKNHLNQMNQYKVMRG